jgi:hypothetical protein
VELAEILVSVPDALSEPRTHEPVTVGIPFPAGTARHANELALSTRAGEPVPAQWAVLERWPVDGSIRWALLDAPLTAPGTYCLRLGEPATPARHADPVVFVRESRRCTIAIERWSCVVETGSSELLSATGHRAGQSFQLRLAAAGPGNEPLEFQVREIAEETMGPLRTTLRIDGTLGLAQARRVNVRARLSFFAGRPAVRVELTLHNPGAARHPGGYWELGDEGSVQLRHVSLELAGPPSDRVLCSERPQATVRTLALPATIFQGSSGGEQWRSRVHVNRNGVVPMTLSGYELSAPGFQSTGKRAAPVFWREDEHGGAAITVQHFWQNFPTALEADADRLVAHLFPSQAGDLHELQGGEQKTHVVGLAFEADSVAPRPLDWIARPALVAATPRWYQQARAVPYLTSMTDETSPYERLVRGAIEGPHSFERKRETIDEYGWRHFGDLFADHESAFEKSGALLVSHYNNQYDAVGGFATQFMRSGDARWWIAMDELARHVVDIDIYHTQEDKAAYSGGLFWHTYHYKDAGRATHRCYPHTEGVNGGGPSSEQNYSTGLMLYFLLTGHLWAREAVIGLADWVLRMDDGSRTIFRWLSRAPTGLASGTASTAYHGPGRGAGNSILSLLNAFRLTGARAYLEYAEALIRRCIHPEDDVPARHLLDTERKWSYTVFLQSLARYLDDKALRGELDGPYAYARASLLAYARWMADHEYPYLERPEILEYPTETWAAQDMRKCEVFLHASRHAPEPERMRLRERADFFYRASLDWLYRCETRSFTRPVVLMLSYGFMYQSTRLADGLEQAPAGPTEVHFGRPRAFVPQRVVALKRARLLAMAGAFAALALLGWLVAPLVTR